MCSDTSQNGMKGKKNEFKQNILSKQTQPGSCALVIRVIYLSTQEVK